mgnify:CR=1 FL=1
MENDSVEENKSAVDSAATNTEEEILTPFIPITFRFTGFKTDTDITKGYPFIYEQNENVIEKFPDNFEISDLTFESTGFLCLQSFSVHYEQPGDFTFSINGKYFRTSISYKNGTHQLEAYYLSGYYLRECLTAIVQDS